MRALQRAGAGIGEPGTTELSPLPLPNSLSPETGESRSTDTGGREMYTVFP